MPGRELELLAKGVTALERIAAAFEREESVEIEGVPPSVCPFCETQNPTVTQLGVGVGPVDEFVLVGETHCCNKTVFCVPVQMLIAPNRSALDEIQGAKKGGNHDGSD